MKNWLRNRKLWVTVTIVLFCLSLILIYRQYQTSARTATANKVESYFKKTGTSQTDKAVKPVKTIQPPVNVIVDLKGAVRKPGIYRMNAGERVSDAVARAGGLTGKADENKINLAQKVVDEMVIFVPEKGEKIPAEISSASAGSSQKPVSEATGGGGQININTADEQALQHLTGIGPAKAKAIIQYREQHGPFKSVDDLNGVSGIGDKSLEKIRPDATVQ
jgi:competence protein ComEA helix-hairpin-helix repeat region